MDPMRYYLNIQNTSEGPFTLDELAVMLREGKIDRTTVAVIEGTAKWIPLSDLQSVTNLKSY